MTKRVGASLRLSEAPIFPMEWKILTQWEGEWSLEAFTPLIGCLPSIGAAKCTFPWGGRLHCQEQDVYEVQVLSRGPLSRYVHWLPTIQGKGLQRLHGSGARRLPICVRKLFGYA